MLQWISNGLREFWDKATVLRIARQVFCKQYCLRSIRQLAETTSCIARARRKTGAPKLSAAFPPAGGFGYFLFIKKKKVTLFCRTK